MIGTSFSALKGVERDSGICIVKNTDVFKLTHFPPWPLSQGCAINPFSVITTKATALKWAKDTVLSVLHVLLLPSYSLDIDITIPTNGCRNWIKLRLSYLPKITWLISGEATIWTDATWLWIMLLKMTLKVCWTARRSNQSILKEINPEHSLEGPMLKLKLQYFGHLMLQLRPSQINK